MIRDWQSNRSDITKAATSPERSVADRLGRWLEGYHNLVIKCLYIFYNLFSFLIFVSEKRASEIIERKIQSLFQREVEASSKSRGRGRINGVAHRGSVSDGSFFEFFDFFIGEYLQEHFQVHLRIFSHGSS